MNIFYRNDDALVSICVYDMATNHPLGSKDARFGFGAHVTHILRTLRPAVKPQTLCETPRRGVSLSSIMDVPRFTTRFTAQARVLQASDPKRHEARASLDLLRDLLPPDVNPENDVDLVYIGGNLAVSSVANANDDAISFEDALRVYKRFERKPCNVEHDRDQTTGYILIAGLTEFGTDRVITEDEARAAGKPFNIATIAVLWKVVNKDLCDYILSAATPGSPDKELSLSFEVGFDDYNIVLLPKGTRDLAKATKVIPAGSMSFGRFDPLLRVNRGKGVTKDGETVARVLTGNIVPLGQGIVRVPAAAVKGIIPFTDATDTPEDGADAGYSFSSTQLTFSPEDAKPFVGYAASIPDEHLYAEEGDDSYGRCSIGDVHATIFYGIKDNDHSTSAAALAPLAPIKIRLGKTSVFKTEGSPYHVLKVDVEGDAIHQAHHAVKDATKSESKWPDFSPHITLAYMRPGFADLYAGDTRFEGKEATFSSVTFSPAEGARTEIQLMGTAADDESDDDDVYGDDEMAASKYIKLSQGWQERLAFLQTKEPLVNGVNVTLSDGRTLSNVKIFDGATLELDKELSFSGIIVTDMTPGVAPQSEDTSGVHPHLGDEYPTKRPEKQAEDKMHDAAQKVAQNSPYTDAHVKTLIVAMERLLLPAKTTTAAETASTLSRIGLSANDAGLSIRSLTDALNAFAATSSVSDSAAITHPMTIDDIKQAVASLTTAKTPDEAKANSEYFSKVIADFSEKSTKDLQAAEAARAEAVASADALKTQVAELTQKMNLITAAEEARAAQAQFDARMESVEAMFDLDDETRAFFVEDVKACADDASFDKWFARAQKVSKALTKTEKAKTAAAAAPKKDDKKAADDKEDAKDGGDDEDDETCKAAAKQAIASAQANRVDADIVNTIDANISLKEQFAKAFGDMSIGGKTLNELSAEKQS